MHLEEVIEQSNFECPICKLTQSSVEQIIGSLLYEAVNDPSVRAKLRIEGLCRKHVEKIEMYLSKHRQLGSMGLAIIYADMLDHLTNFVQSGTEPEMTNRCVLCDKEGMFEEMYIESFVENIESMITLYESSNAVLCYSHYAEISSRLGSILKDRLQRIQVSKFKHLVNLLHSYVDKHDYRNKVEFSKEEIWARKAAGYLVGKSFKVLHQGSADSPDSILKSIGKKFKKRGEK